MSLQSATLAVAVALMSTAAQGGGLVIAGLILATLAAFVALEAAPTLTGWTSPRARQWASTGAAVVFALAWLAFLVMASTTTQSDLKTGATAAAFAVPFFVSLVFLAFLPYGYRWLTLLSLATGLLAVGPSLDGLLAALGAFAIGVFAMGIVQITLWALRLVEEQERAKGVEAQLQIAEERLRFGRDLHDVVGRSFSAIAVKSELAASLSQAGANDRAVTEMQEVKSLAVDSMEEMRSLVRGYRGIDLASEVSGARSLLQAAGCELYVEGDVEGVPADWHEVAAWVVREGTTNIVRHSQASRATLALGAAGMSLRNNGARGTSGRRSGLLGLQERLNAVGASLDVTTNADEFTLQIHWEAA